MLYGCFNSSENVCQQNNCDVFSAKKSNVISRKNLLENYNFLVKRRSIFIRKNQFDVNEIRKKTLAEASAVLKNQPKIRRGPF